MRRSPSSLRVLMAALVVGTAGCATDSLLGPDAAQGIEGLVLLGPQCPVQSQDDPCPDLPYEVSIEVRVAGGGSVTRIRSDEKGEFRVGLRPGFFTLRPATGNPFPAASEQDVEVRAGEFSTVTILFDTGIR